MSWLRIKTPVPIPAAAEGDRITGHLQIRSINGDSTPITVRCRNCGAIGRVNRKAMRGRTLERCRECK